MHIPLLCPLSVVRSESIFSAIALQEKGGPHLPTLRFRPNSTQAFWKLKLWMLIPLHIIYEQHWEGSLTVTCIWVLSWQWLSATLHCQTSFQKVHIHRQTLLLVFRKANLWFYWLLVKKGTPHPQYAKLYGWQCPAELVLAYMLGRCSSQDQSWSPFAKRAFCSFWICLNFAFLWFWNHCEQKAVLVA